MIVTSTEQATGKATNKKGTNTMQTTTKTNRTARLYLDALNRHHTALISGDTDKITKSTETLMARTNRIADNLVCVNRAHHYAGVALGGHPLAAARMFTKLMKSNGTL